MNVKRNYKDTVYRMVFHIPENALSLYNAVNGTSYTDHTALKFNTLDNAVYMEMKNDLSFLILNEMHLYEQQSTRSGNMPLRDLLYISELIHEYVHKRTLYGSRKILLPNPHFVVFYNGAEKAPEQEDVKLSDAYMRPDKTPELELKVKILNINPGMNEELKDKCPVLREYVTYVDRVRENVRYLPLNEAVEQAIDSCIRDNILRDFLTKERAKVHKTSILERDWRQELKLIREDEREFGREEERRNTEREKENSIKIIVSLCKKHGKGKEETAKEIVVNYGIVEELAREKVMLYWDR